MRKEPLLSIESILSETYEWISGQLKISINPVGYPEIYKKIANLFKDKWNLLSSLFKDLLNDFYELYYDVKRN